MSNGTPQTIVSMTGDDTLVINGTVITDFADATVAELKFTNDLAVVKTGKNGNSLVAMNAQGLQAEMTIRVIRASPDDKYLQGILSNQSQAIVPGQASSSSTGISLANGTFTKVIISGTYDPTSGNVTNAPVNDVYTMQFGIFSKFPEVKSNVEGDTEQSCTIYTIKWGFVTRNIA